MWSLWGKCSAECGKGATQQRRFEVSRLEDAGRGLHSSTFLLNVSTFRGLQTSTLRLDVSTFCGLC